jgi:hypothetical protein
MKGLIPMTQADSVHSTQRGTASKVDRGALMSRAWAIFRQTYCYPQIKFSDIGRKCFAWALRQAWIEAKEAARVAALAPAIKAERIATLQTLIAYAGFIDSGPQWKAAVSAHRDEIRQLQGA